MLTGLQVGVPHPPGSDENSKFGDGDELSVSPPADGMSETASRILGMLEEYGSLFGIESGSEPDLDFDEPAATTLENLETVGQIVRQMTLHLRYGDYAGRLWKCLDYASRRVHKPWPSTVTAFAEELKLEERIEEGDASSILQEVVNLLNEEIEDLGGKRDSVSIDMAKAAIKVYATRNRISHADVKSLGARGQNLSLERDLKALDVPVHGGSFGNRELWTRIVNFWEESREWFGDERTRRLTNQSSFLAIAPSTAAEKVEFQRDLEQGLLRGQLKPFYDDGGARRPNIPPRTRDSTRSDPMPYMTRKRKMDLSPAPSSFDDRPSKQKK